MTGILLGVKIIMGGLMNNNETLLTINFEKEEEMLAKKNKLQSDLIQKEYFTPDKIKKDYNDFYLLGIVVCLIGALNVVYFFHSVVFASVLFGSLAGVGYKIKNKLFNKEVTKRTVDIKNMQNEIDKASKIIEVRKIISKYLRFRALTDEEKDYWYKYDYLLEDQMSSHLLDNFITYSEFGVMFEPDDNLVKEYASKAKVKTKSARF